MIILDEGSMVSKRITHHILQTVNEISIRPILVVCGDHGQQQPFEGEGGHSQNVRSMFQHQMISTRSQVFTLQIQNRSNDPDFLDMLSFLRIWQPSQQQLDEFQDEMVISHSDIPLDTDIKNAYDDHPDAVFLTVSRAATKHVNNVLINHLFGACQPLANVPCDLSNGMINIYTGM